MNKKQEIEVGDVVFQRRDKRKIYPIRITSVSMVDNEITYKGRIANDRGVMIYKRFKKPDLVTT